MILAALSTVEVAEFSWCLRLTMARYHEELRLEGRPTKLPLVNPLMALRKLGITTGELDTLVVHTVTMSARHVMRILTGVKRAKRISVNYSTWA